MRKHFDGNRSLIGSGFVQVRWIEKWVRRYCLNNAIHNMFSNAENCAVGTIQPPRIFFQYDSCPYSVIVPPMPVERAMSHKGGWIFLLFFTTLFSA